ncbi:ArnT family glycosyltransferase [Pedobacter immunditicola]|uniref:ArnT family glycosyltransferase n=1 Tax=Pedobacter immunditicola TaxID=3133440 RepID=UPI0030B5169C
MEVLASSNRIKWLYGFIGLAVLINFSGLGITIISPDGALYASIAKNMVINKDFISLTSEGRDWLDKPHFPFWVAAISFKLFGISTWAYKLPAILFMMMGAVYTYKFAKDLYHKEIGLWAVLILLTAQHIIISNNDVRAEPYLTGLIIAAVFHFYRSTGLISKAAGAINKSSSDSAHGNWFWHLLLGSIFAACAVMTKGIFALIPIAAAIAGHLIITKQWKLLFNLRWLLAAVFILLFIVPELWCLYQQFDLHPEKVVFGKTNVSGLKFFFWDSQFGRFFNTGPIKKTGGDPFFFLHTTLWAFLPWAILFYIAVVRYLRKYVKQPQRAEWYTLCGAGFTFLIFSLTEFQLPHYLNILFPFFAIITAQYIYNLESPAALKATRIIQGIIISLMVLVIMVLDYYFEPEQYSIPFVISMVFCLVLIFITARYSNLGRYKIYFQSAAVAFLINFYFNWCYYPVLTTYQADSEAAFYINKHNMPQLPVVKVVNGYSYAIDFYIDQPLYYYRTNEQQQLPQKPYLVYGDTEILSQLNDAGLQGQTLKTFRFYPITRIKGKFLNRETRAGVLRTSQLILIK